MLTPHDTGSYTTVGLGIPSGSLATSRSYDKFYLVSGGNEGWHIYAEDSERIRNLTTSGEIEYKGKLRGCQRTYIQVFIVDTK